MAFCFPCFDCKRRGVPPRSPFQPAYFTSYSRKNSFHYTDFLDPAIWHVRIHANKKICFFAVQRPFLEHDLALYNRQLGTVTWENESDDSLTIQITTSDKKEIVVFDLLPKSTQTGLSLL